MDNEYGNAEQTAYPRQVDLGSAETRQAASVPAQKPAQSLVELPLVQPRPELPLVQAEAQPLQVGPGQAQAQPQPQQDVHFQPLADLPQNQLQPEFTDQPSPSEFVQKRQKTGRGLTFLVGLLGVITGAAISVTALYFATSGFSFSGQIETPPSADSPIIVQATDNATELAVAVAVKVIPSVVNIDVFATAAGSLLNDFVNVDAEDIEQAPEQIGLGSGVILTADGYILTNYHVVADGESFLVSLDNEVFEAVRIGEDPSSDLAVIKIEAMGLVPIELGDSDSVRVGQWVMAVGSPFGLEKSVSTGIISALYRSTAMQSQNGTTIFANLIQTDAAINPGNSGGALVNSMGQLIGINTLINTTSGSNAGVGFAVPSNYAWSVAQQIINGEEVRHPFLGITIYSVDASNAAELGVRVQSGAYVESVQPGSPAEIGGIEAGDVITSIGNTNITTSAELIIEIRKSYSVGSSVQIGINRNGQTHYLTVVLGSTTN